MTAARLAKIRKAIPGRFGRILRGLGTRFLIGWATFLGFIVGGSNCPFCGRVGCPQGIASAGIVAGIVVAVTNGVRRSKGTRKGTPFRAGGTAHGAARSFRRKGHAKSG